MNSTSRAILGATIAVLGFVLGVYIGVFWGIIGGIVEFVEGIKSDPVNAYMIAWGVLRFWCGGAIGATVSTILITIGIKVIGD